MNKYYATNVELVSLSVLATLRNFIYFLLSAIFGLDVAAVLCIGLYHNDFCILLSVLLCPIILATILIRHIVLETVNFTVKTIKERKMDTLQNADIYHCL
jgi:hypothetical protein